MFDANIKWHDGIKYIISCFVLQPNVVIVALKQFLANRFSFTSYVSQSVVLGSANVHNSRDACKLRIVDL